MILRRFTMVTTVLTVVHTAFHASPSVHKLGGTIQALQPSRRLTMAAFSRSLPHLVPALRGPRPLALSAIASAQRGWGSVGLVFVSTHSRTCLHSTSKAYGENKVLEIDGQIAADDMMTSSTTSEEGKVNLYAYNATGLEQLLVSWGQPKFRSKQVWDWLHVRGTTDFDLMQDLPKDLRAKLKQVATLGTLKLAVQQVSKDGTIKRAYQLHDGQMIESVLMPYNDGRRTACISSQAGCAMGCVFCATGQMGFARQLTSSEILEQVQRFHVELLAKGERLSNVVLMGMGEPLGNYNNVLEAVRRMNSEVGIGARHITISTVGLVPRILRLATEGLQVKLAVSLHAATDAERSAIMPVNLRWPLDELMAACNQYVSLTGRRITFEWALIAGTNDTPEVAHTLGKLLGKLNSSCHVNLIPLNPTDGYAGKPTKAADCQVFIDILAQYGVAATPRVRRGIDIDAGCGQLKAKVNKVLGRGGAPV